MNKREKLRIVFMGTPDFAVATLAALIDHDYNVVGVITAPDRQAGRGRTDGRNKAQTLLVTKKINR